MDGGISSPISFVAMSFNMEIHMTSREVAHLRIANQQMAGTHFTRPADLVQWMSCMQAQDFHMAKWAVGCRLREMSDASVEQDFNDGKILRTHVLRPTWHFVCPADIRWLLKLSAPKVKAMCRIYHQKLGIDHAILRQSKKIITKALNKHGRLTREELSSILHKEKINVSESRVGHLLMDAELDALICSAGRAGNKFSYQLLDEAVPVSDIPDYEESLAELAKRYFFSRGPASIQDFAWWANLSLSEARKGLDMNKQHLQHVSVNGNDYWVSAKAPIQPMPGQGRSTFLLPAFDEYMVAYKNRDDVLDPRFAGECNSGLGPVIVYNGQIAGTWRRTGEKGSIHIEFSHFGRIPARTKAIAFATASKRYLAFSTSQWHTYCQNCALTRKYDCW
jgi:hypothetical protein